MGQYEEGSCWWKVLECASTLPKLHTYKGVHTTEHIGMRYNLGGHSGPPILTPMIEKSWALVKKDIGMYMQCLYGAIWFFISNIGSSSNLTLQCIDICNHLHVHIVTHLFFSFLSHKMKRGKKQECIWALLKKLWPIIVQSLARTFPAMNIVELIPVPTYHDHTSKIASQYRSCFGDQSYLSCISKLEETFGNFLSSWKQCLPSISIQRQKPYKILILLSSFRRSCTHKKIIPEMLFIWLFWGLLIVKIWLLQQYTCRPTGR